jgi:tetratricopeptide (TPR) repeat protein
MVKFNKKPLLAAYVLLSLMNSLFISNSFSQDIPRYAELAYEASIAFEKMNYKEAIKKAEECIDKFGQSAIKEELLLERNNTPLPPEGTVTEVQRNEIIKRNLLNAVATCWFIKGRSFEREGNTEQAIKAYQETEKYKYARAYERELGGFWSPAKAAKERKDYFSKQFPIITPPGLR